jgi:hypothetical protein
MAAAKKGTTQKLVDAVIAQRDGKPLTLATTRIVYALTLGDDEQAVTERVIDGDMVARLLEVAGDPEHLFDPEHIALQVKTVADLLGRIADHSDDDGPLYFLGSTGFRVGKGQDRRSGSRWPS